MQHSNFICDPIRTKELRIQLVESLISQGKLAIWLKFEEYIVSNRKNTISTVFIMLLCHPVLSTQQMETQQLESILSSSESPVYSRVG